MSAYVIGHITVKDAEKWEAYRRQVPGTLEPWRGQVIFRGRLAAVLAGEHEHNSTVVIQFPDQDAVQGWYRSAEYQALVSLRTEAADIVLVSYDE
jgi:uncharacterized protein (DUF1330 family)